MRSSPCTLTQQLRESFYNDPPLKLRCMQSVQKHWQAGEVNRLFDDFPSVLTPQQRHVLKDEYFTILTAADLDLLFNKDSENPLQLEGDTLALLDDWVQRIAKTGCRALFSEQQLKPELKILLGLRPDQRVDSCDLLCAYIGKAHLDIIETMPDKVIKAQEAFSAICNHINPRYHQWAAMVLDDAGIPYTKAHPMADEQPKSIKSKPAFTTTEKTAIGAGIIGASILGILSIGMALYNTNHDDAPKPPEKKYPHR